MEGLFVRSLDPGMGVAVAERTILRKDDSNTIETWGEVAHRVALGNTGILPGAESDFLELRAMIAKGALLMSGRHLQHGDETQHLRNMEVFTNCATAATSFALFMLLLNGSGVGRDYSDHMMLVNWDNMPDIMCALDETHPDYHPGLLTFAQATKLARDAHRNYTVIEVEDSREGWAKCIEYVETAAYRGEKDSLIIFDFTQVRPKGAPIAGMQNRPSSGPVPTMEAFDEIAQIKGAGYEPWEQTMRVDHALAACVVVGGARRAARMATKSWKDKSISKFIKIKSEGGLWSSNNSVLVDQEFWTQARYGLKHTPAAEVFEQIARESYFGGGGEPGIINGHKLQGSLDGLDLLYVEGAFGSSKFHLTKEGKKLVEDLFNKALTSDFSFITNPCGEVSLSVWGGYCVIADGVPLFCDSDEEAERMFRAATRALIRVNMLPGFYSGEVKRTNRIGVGFTGIHEYAFKRFGFGFRDLIDEKKSHAFWSLLGRFSAAIRDEARTYSALVGVNSPHTVTTVKPAGTTSKLFGLSEGAHLPSMRFFLRWVQFRNGDPLIEQYRSAGYPVKELVTYKGTTIVGFPTEPLISTLGMGDLLVTAAEATPEEQYQWLKLVEKYWIGVDDDKGNQISYTLKYNPKIVDFEQFKAMMLKHQSEIRCCSVMPQTDLEQVVYEYLPEEEVSEAYFRELQGNIFKSKIAKLKEQIDMDTLQCASGACPL